MSAPPGRSFPFPSRTSMYWETCHVTYDQAVEMFNAQTATQQAMGQNPIVSSTKLKRVKYSSIHDAQAEYSKQTIEKSLDFEKRILEVKETGNQSAKSLVDHINSYDAPTVDGIKGSDETKTKSVGDDAAAPEIAPPKVFTKSSKLAPGEVCAGDCRELATDTGDIAIYRSISASNSEDSKDAGLSDKNKIAGGSADVMVLGGLAATAGYRGAASLEMFLDRAAISAGTVLAELSTYGLRFVGGVASAAVALLYSPSAGDSSYLNTEDILYRNRVNTLIRFTFDNEGKVHGYHLDLTEVPKRTVEKVGDNFVVELEPGITIEWFPEVAETDKGNVLVNPIPEIDPHNIYIYPEADQGKELDNTYITPVSDVEFNDYILTFPSETGISPLYLVYNESLKVGGRKTLFHYTNDAGLEGILKSKELLASTKAHNPKDARYGDGQYLSDIVPGTKTNGQLSKAFLNVPWQGKKFKNYVEIDISDLNVVEGRGGVFVVPNSGPLDVSKRIVSSGSNE